MFTKTLTTLTMTSGPADRLLGNIGGSPYKEDTSFLATLRVMLYKRLRGGSVFLRWGNNGESAIKDAVAAYRSGSGKDEILGVIPGSSPIFGGNGILHVFSVNSTNEEVVSGYLTAVDEVFSASSDLKRFKELKDLSVFLHQKKIEARFYIDEENNNVQIFIGWLDMKRWHLLQSFLPRYYPQLFADAPVTPEELALLKSLTQHSSSDYEALIESMSKRFDFRMEKIKTMLAGFDACFLRNDLKDTQKRIASTRNEISYLDGQFADLYQRLHEAMIREAGLMQKINTLSGEDSEIIDYFLCNKGLTLVSAENGRIEFIVSTTISNFDPDVFDSAIKNPNGFFYRSYYNGEGYENKEMTDERIRRLMTAIFGTEELKLRVCAAYSLNFRTGDYAGYKNYAFPDSILAENTPNQHIQHYACLGNNNVLIRRAVTNRDFVGAISACCASATNFNMTEANTGTYFMNLILGNDPGRIIQMPDGSTMTPLDAVKWLEARDGETE